jgi:predicted DsbA family dithiol-disulfide isomerase
MLKNNKKLVVFAVWIAVLAALFFAINKLNQVPADGPPAPVIPKVDVAKLAKNWTEIINHASPPQGSPTAPYSIVEFGDFECPQCFQTRPIVEGVVKTAPVNLYFVQRPIQGHEYAIPAAEASLSANAHGKFWPMYDALYVHQKDLEPGFYGDYAARIGLNGPALQKDVDGNRYLNQVKESAKFCDSLGIVGTPTIALRDNKTGVISAAVGRPNIVALLKEAPWTTAAQPESGSAVAAAPGVAPQTGTMPPGDDAGSIATKGQ